MKSLYTNCSVCRVCEGSGYQSSPGLYVGKIDAPILMIGQNPGEISLEDSSRLYWANISKVRTNPTELKDINEWDFITSTAVKRLARMWKWENWFESGTFLFTNAVRCRTKSNATPSDQMTSNCSIWTNQLLVAWSEVVTNPQKRAIVVMGGIARKQLFNKNAHLYEWGTVCQGRHYLPFGTWEGVILTVRHYSAWRAESEVLGNQLAAERALKLIGIER